MSQPSDTRIETISNALYHAELPEDRYVVAKEALDAVAAELAETNARYTAVRRAYGIETQERGRLEGELAELRRALERAIVYVKNMQMPDTGVIGPGGEREHDYHEALLHEEVREWEAALSRGVTSRAAMTDIPEEGDERFSARYSDYVKFIEAGGGPLERR